MVWYFHATPVTTRTDSPLAECRLVGSNEGASQARSCQVGMPTGSVVLKVNEGDENDDDAAGPALSSGRRRFWTIHQPAHASSGTAQPDRNRTRRNNQRPSNEAPSRLMFWTLEGRGAAKRLAWSSETSSPRERYSMSLSVCTTRTTTLLPGRAAAVAAGSGCLTICDGEQKAQLAWRRRSTRLDSGPHLGALGSWISVWSASNNNNQQQTHESLAWTRKH